MVLKLRMFGFAICSVMAKNSDETLNFSFISVPESPVANIKSRNLTGNVRIIRDCMIHIYNCTQLWNEHIISGLPIVIELGDIQPKDRILAPDIKLKQENAVDTVLDSKVQDLSDKLGIICNNLKLCFEQIKENNATLQAVIELEEMKSYNTILFLSWPTCQFGEFCEKICKMYQKELSFKFRIRENLSYCNNHDTAQFLIKSWLFQLYVEDDIDLKAMLKEIGS